MSGLHGLAARALRKLDPEDAHRAAIRALDVVTDANAAQTEIQTGVLTINERRKQKHRPAVEGGDNPLVNSTMMPLSRALNPPTK